MRESLSEPAAVEVRRDSTRRMGLREAVRAADSGVGAAGIFRRYHGKRASDNSLSRAMAKLGSQEPSRVVPRVNPSSLQ